MPPRVSFVVFAYQHAAFVRDAVRAAFAQDYSPLEIVLSDDGSSDGTFAIMEEEEAAYRGPHDIVLNRNPANLGGPRHHNRIMEIARGDLIVIAHGDDASLPQRTRRLVETWQAHAVSMVTSDATLVDERSQPLGPMCGLRGLARPSLAEIVEDSARRTLVGATMAWSREVFDRFGPINAEMLPIGPTDQLLPLRAGFLSGVAYLGEPLVLWRQHPGNVHRRLYDRTQDDAVLRESLLASAIAVRVCMFEDLMRMRQEQDGAAWIESGLDALNARIFHLTRLWMRARGVLVSRGQRPAWIDRKRYEAIPVNEALLFQPAPGKGRGA